MTKELTSLSGGMKSWIAPRRVRWRYCCHLAHPCRTAGCGGPSLCVSVIGCAGKTITSSVFPPGLASLLLRDQGGWQRTRRRASYQHAVCSLDNVASVLDEACVCRRLSVSSTTVPSRVITTSVLATSDGIKSTR